MISLRQILKEAEGSSEVIVDKKDLPPVIRKIIESELGVAKKPHIYLIVGEEANFYRDPLSVMENTYAVNLSNNTYAILPRASFGSGATGDVKAALSAEKAIVHVVRSGQGYNSAHVYIHPDTMRGINLLPASTHNLDDVDKIVLVTIKSLIPVARKEIFMKVPGSRESIEKLKGMGYLNKMGALTIQGKNMAETVRKQVKEESRGKPAEEWWERKMNKKYDIYLYV